MNNLQDLINLAKVDGGKFFVIDEQANIKLVIMPVEEYERLLIGKLQKQVLDVEAINREILKAQLTEDVVPSAVEPKPTAKIFEKGPTVTSNPIDPSRINGHMARQGHVDLREEVIDPSFDFEGPKMEIDDLQNTN